MTYLYLTVVIIGVLAIPIVAGTMYAKQLEKRRKDGYTTRRADPFDYGMGAFIAIILLIGWPFTLPVGLIGGFFYMLFKAPEYLMNRRSKK